MKKFTTTLLSYFEEIKAFLLSDTFKSKLMKVGIGSVILKISYTVLSFLMGVTLVRAMGAENYGIYSYVISIIVILNIPAEFGLPTLVLRETAKNSSKNAWSKIKGVWNWSTKFILLVTGLFFIVALMLLLIWGNRFDILHEITFLLGVFLLPIMAVGHLRKAQLIGLNKVIFGQLPEGILQPLIIAVLIMILTLVSSAQITPPEAMTIRIVAASISLIVGTLFLKKHKPAGIKHSPEEVEKKRWIRSALPFVANNGINVLNQKAGLIILGLFVNPVEISYYKIAVNIAIAAHLGISMVALVANPQYAILHEAKEKRKLKKLVKYGSLFSFLVCVLAFIFFSFFGKFFISLF
jgi:O-antigen/teichoic acid export membrane protein